MNKFLLKRININWTTRQLVNYMTEIKKNEPELFTDGSKMSIMVIK